MSDHAFTVVHMPASTLLHGVPTGMILDNELSDGAARTWLVLRCNAGRPCTQNALARQRGKSLGTLRRHLDELEAARWLWIHRRAHPTASGKYMNIYHLFVDPADQEKWLWERGQGVHLSGGHYQQGVLFHADQKPPPVPTKPKPKARKNSALFVAVVEYLSSKPYAEAEQLWLGRANKVAKQLAELDIQPDELRAFGKYWTDAKPGLDKPMSAETIAPQMALWKDEDAASSSVLDGLLP